ncbi:MAG: DNA polymerase Y family protein, partial [Phycisphaerae bacterium]
PDRAAARPLRLLPRPQPIQAMAVVPDQPPIWFRCRGREHRMRCTAGPERLSAEWWTGETGARDYYAVEDEAGSRFWVFREGESGRWYLHGVFE